MKNKIQQEIQDLRDMSLSQNLEELIYEIHEIATVLNDTYLKVNNPSESEQYIYEFYDLLDSCRYLILHIKKLVKFTKKYC